MKTLTTEEQARLLKLLPKFNRWKSLARKSTLGGVDLSYNENYNLTHFGFTSKDYAIYTRAIYHFFGTLLTVKPISSEKFSEYLLHY